VDADVLTARVADGIAVITCDMRLASRENTLLSQPEVDLGVNRGL
jgi:hypothetical protein